MIPNGSAVVATTVSNCTRYLAVGVKSGIVTIWDLKTSHNSLILINSVLFEVVLLQISVVELNKSSTQLIP